MADSLGVDPAAVAAWKNRLLEHLRKRPRDNIQLETIRTDRALEVAVMQLLREQAPRLVLIEFGTSMTLSRRITLDGLHPETLAALRQDQLIIDADTLLDSGDELPDAPGRPSAVSEGSAD